MGLGCYHITYSQEKVTDRVESGKKDGTVGYFVLETMMMERRIITWLLIRTFWTSDDPNGAIFAKVRDGIARWLRRSIKLTARTRS